MNKDAIDTLHIDFEAMNQALPRKLSKNAYCNLKLKRNPRRYHDEYCRAVAR